MLTDIPKTFYFYRFGLTIIAKVTAVREIHDEGLEIDFEGGTAVIWADSRILKVTRPPNLIRKCDSCYQVMNEYDEPIGYIYN
jgi:hypothetical protein